VTAEPASELERLTRKFRPPLIAFFSRRVASLAEAEDMTQEIVSARESISILWAAIQALPEPTQQIFILYRVENIPKQTIADNFGFHLRTVDKHISRALVFLARRMERRT